MLRLALRYLKGWALACAIAAPLLMLVEVGMDLQQPILMARVVDVGVARGDLRYVLSTGALMITLTIVGFAGGALCSLFASRAAVTMAADMRLGVFRKVQAMSFAEIDGFRASSLVTRLTNDVMQMQSTVIMLLRIMVRAPIMLIGSVVMCCVLSPRLSLVFCLILPLVTVSVAAVLTKATPVFMGVQKSLDRVNSIMRENLLGARVVKACNLESAQAGLFQAANAELTERSVGAQGLTFLLLPAVTLVMNLSVVAVLWFGGGLARTGSLEIGRIMAFVNYLIQISHSLMMAVNLAVNLSRAQASASRIGEVLATEPSVVDPVSPATPVASVSGYDIEFRNVSFAYSGSGDAALKDVSFTIRGGETVGVIGATGSGKTTLASLIPRLYDATSGQVLFGGRDVRDLSLRELRARVGFVTQESLLFSGTIADNLRFGDGDASLADLEVACRDAQALDFVDALPARFEAPVEQRARNFSGGQKQRLSLARSFLGHGDVLILDDSMSAVDLATEARLRSALAARMAGRTLVVIAQRVSAVMDADRVIVLDFGRVVGMGTHRELLRSCPIYRDIAVSQLGKEIVDDER